MQVDAKLTGRDGGAPSSLAMQIVDRLKRAGIQIVTLLPDAWMVRLIEAVAADPQLRLVRISREDEGVGLCAGAYLGGKKAVVIAQNAGFLLSANALAALSMHHQIPVLILIVQRGGHDDDQYYQIYKGRVTVPVLDAIGIPYHFVDGPEDFHIIEQASQQAYLARTPVAVLLSRSALVEARP